jgi:membrane-bound lytic murein transglycosylase A
MEPTRFDDLDGWAPADLLPAWRVFRRGALDALARPEPLRPALPPDAALLEVFRFAAGAPEDLNPDEARAFFERHFTPMRIPSDSGGGLLTGYYEPIVDGSPVRTARFTAPILSRPADLVSFPPQERPAAVPKGFSAARRLPGGQLVPYDDRAALERYAVSSAAQPVVWLRDWTEVFVIHVQGSARVRLVDGPEIRLVYAGRNGHPYTSIGRILIEAGEIAEPAMSLDALKTWIRAHGQNEGEPGRVLMQRNQSYIFFRAETVGDSGRGPTGGAGRPLAALTSIAVDRSIWSYGLPFWIATPASVPGFGPEPLARLFVAEDTGSAILGPARADLFLGSGNEAGCQAGLVRHRADFTVLWPGQA